LQAEAESQVHRIAAVLRSGVQLPGVEGSDLDPEVASDTRTDRFSG